MFESTSGGYVMTHTQLKLLSSATIYDVDKLYAERSHQLHNKIDATRDAYFGFIFPINRSDLNAVSEAFGLPSDVANHIALKSREFSTFRVPGRKFGQLTNHIYGASILALRGKDLDTGLASVDDRSLIDLATTEEATVLEIAEARSSWFGRIYFPAQAFANALTVFGGKVAPDTIFNLAEKYGYASTAGDRRTVRGDFGIALWLTMLGRAP
jgi:hypothetical protein